MKKSIFLLILTILAAPLYKACGDEAREPRDKMIGDWAGNVVENGEPVVAQIVSLGDGKYEAKILPRFDSRVDPIAVMSGQKLKQSIAFESESMHGIIEAGVFRGGEKKQDDALNFTMEPVERISPTLGQQPPEGAIVLFDGTGLSGWQKLNTDEPAAWKLTSGDDMEIVEKSGSIESKQQFYDFALHLEFRTPFMPDKSGQNRGNSGLYIQGRYEIQILDSYSLEGLDNECGGIYKVSAPRVNMCAPPLQWQTYDVDFTAAKFDENGNKVRNAVITVIHNGVPIHENLELPNITPGGKTNTESPDPGPIMLQDHKDPVRFRNIWAIDKSKTQNDEE